MFRLFCLVLLGWLGTTAAFAQDEAYRPFYSVDTLRRHELAVAQRSALRAEIPVPKTGSSEYRAHYRRMVEEASAEVYNAIRYAALLDPVVEPYVQQVFARILRANPQLPATTRLVLTRNPEPNAHAVGRSTMLLNLCLLPPSKTRANWPTCSATSWPTAPATISKQACATVLPPSIAKSSGANSGASSTPSTASARS